MQRPTPPRPELLTARQVEAFRQVFIAGSISGAARAMNVSQPAVSRLIHDMEEALGLALFVRRGPRIRSTLVAEQLIVEIERVYLGLDHIRDHARRLRHFPTGQLRIASMMVLSQGFLAGLAGRYAEQEPGVSLSVHSDTSVAIVDQLRRSEHHIGLCSPVGRIDSMLVETRLPPRPAVCILPKDHALSALTRLSPRDLEHADFIALGKSSLLRRQVARVFADAGIRPLVRHETLYSSTAFSMVRAGLGVAIVDPFCLMGPGVEDVEVRPFYPEILYSFSMLVPEVFSAMREIETFGALLLEHLGSCGTM